LYIFNFRDGLDEGYRPENAAETLGGCGCIFCGQFLVCKFGLVQAGAREIFAHGVEVGFGFWEWRCGVFGREFEYEF
jgi:hypothetical protein